jgi:type VI secretion system protein ImpK
MADTLAILFQEFLATVSKLTRGVRLDAEAGVFRDLLLKNLAMSERLARQSGYAGEDVKLAIFALVVFADEVILASKDPVFASWHERSLARQIFDTNQGGEIFFDKVEQILQRDDSAHLADLLEVFQLCLLLGFCGRYHVPARPELHTLQERIARKIEQSRGPAQFRHHWQPPEDGPRVGRDRLIGRLKFALLGIAAAALLCFVAFRLSLGSDINELQASPQGVYTIR